MSVGPDRIDPEQWVLRRIYRGPGYYEPGKTPPVQKGSFRPHPDDHDGLSFYLEREVAPATLAGAADKPAECYLVARLRAGDLYALGLTLTPKEDPGGLPGHIIMPEINTETYSDGTKRQEMRQWCRQLAELASEQIVFGISPDQG